MITDMVIVGSGLAALNFSLEAAKFGKVVIVTKKGVKDTNTQKAQGGMAAVLSDKDSFSKHIKDTLIAGDGVCDKKAVEIVVKNAPHEIAKLLDYGVKFEKKNDVLKLAKEGCHSERRIAYVKDITGKEVEKVLVKKVKLNKNIKILENNYVYDLIVRSKVCYGVKAYDIDRRRKLDIFSKAVMLCTGGAGRLYSSTSNPSVATGEGIALAYNAGALVNNLEFVQFHPTLLYSSSFLISEVVRGEGAVLKIKNGKRFMHKYHKMKELAPRDIVSRAIVNELSKSEDKYVLLDVSHKPKSYLKERFSNIYAHCLKNGIDINKKPIPVVPTAHYMCGGVKTNMKAETSVRGLYAFGEVACTGLHGADRLGSNSLTECMVFGNIALKSVLKYIKNRKIKTFKTARKKLNFNLERALIKRLQKTMWKNVGIIRSENSLKEALAEIKGINSWAKSIQLRHMLTVAELIAKAALRRKESRGTHYRTDYPKKSKLT